MARMTLAQMLKNLRAETGRSVNVAHGVAERETMILLLQRVQEALWYEASWPFLNVDRDITLSAGTRYYNFPADLEYTFVEKVWTKVGSVWSPVEYGISPEDYSTFDSENDIRSWPPCKWDYNADNDQLEVWPLPSQAGILRLEGRRKCDPLVDDDDLSTLDGHLIVLFAAAEVLARAKAEDAPLKLAVAQKHMRRILGRQLGNKREPWLVGGRSSGARKPRPGLDFIPLGYGGSGA